MKKTVSFFAILFLSVGCYAFGPDTLSVDEIRDLKNLAEYNKSWNAFLNVWAILGPILGGVATYLGIKNLIAKWAEDEITKKATEKIGVDWSIIKSLVSERKTLLQKRGAVNIAIINRKTGERKDLSDLISSYGYPTPKFFVFDKDEKDASKAHFSTEFKKGNFHLIILDNEDSRLTEEEITKIINDNSDAFKSNFIWYTKDEVKSFQALTKAGVGFVKQASRFVIELDNRLPTA